MAFAFLAKIVSKYRLSMQRPDAFLTQYFVTLFFLHYMDLNQQLKKLFPDHEPLADEQPQTEPHNLFLQKEPLVCKFEKRNGKPVTIIEGYDGSDEDFKILSKEIKTKFGVGGSFRGGEMLIQGDYRDKIMNLLKNKGFRVKRVGG